MKSAIFVIGFVVSSSFCVSFAYPGYECNGFSGESAIAVHAAPIDVGDQEGELFVFENSRLVLKTPSYFDFDVMGNNGEYGAYFVAQTNVKNKATKWSDFSLSIQPDGKSAVLETDHEKVAMSCVASTSLDRYFVQAANYSKFYEIAGNDNNGLFYEVIEKSALAVDPLAVELKEKAITQAMQGLGMQGGKFDVALTTLEQPAQYGLEQAEFLVAGHSGTTPRPVGKVASGGELSRIALAIAVTTSQLGEAQTLIFDEVDSGVGGAVAETVGRLMKQLGKDRQVMAVTHLPQVAACSDQHLLVAKQTEKGKTFSTVDAVLGEARVLEIARMLGGEKLSNTTLAHAKEMLGQ